MDNDQRKLYYGIIAIMVVVAVVSMLITLRNNSNELQKRLQTNEVTTNQLSNNATNVVE